MNLGNIIKDSNIIGKTKPYELVEPNELGTSEMPTPKVGGEVDGEDTNDKVEETKQGVDGEIIDQVEEETNKEADDETNELFNEDLTEATAEDATEATAEDATEATAEDTTEGPTVEVPMVIKSAPNRLASVYNGITGFSLNNAIKPFSGRSLRIVKPSGDCLSEDESKMTPVSMGETGSTITVTRVNDDDTSDLDLKTPFKKKESAVVDRCALLSPQSTVMESFLDEHDDYSITSVKDRSFEWKQYLKKYCQRLSTCVKDRPFKSELYFKHCLRLSALAALIGIIAMIPHASKAPEESPRPSEVTSNPSQGPIVGVGETFTTHPIATPSFKPTVAPIATSSFKPTVAPIAPVPPKFRPGNLIREEDGLLLSEGLRARVIAHAGKPVVFHNGTFSTRDFHARPDFGATFPDPRPHNVGGWVYTSNSEMKEKGEGGVGAITFDVNGNVIDYQWVLDGTTMNCGGGRTPWNTWVSCEEVEDEGLIYQVDPFNERPAQVMTLGSDGGRWESFAYDIRDKTKPRYFATEDHNKGTVRRFTPDHVDWARPWEMLHTTGITEFLYVIPNQNLTGGMFGWTSDKEMAKNNARSYYPQSEGIDIYGSEMYVVAKKWKQLVTFNLDTMTYTNRTTVGGLFDGMPDQMSRILDSDTDLLYFTEEGGDDAGIHARDENGYFYTILESPHYRDETTGLSFSPDGKHLYVAYQYNGLLFDVWRDDGLPFHARTLNVKYHENTPDS